MPTFKKQGMFIIADQNQFGYNVKIEVDGEIIEAFTNKEDEVTKCSVGHEFLFTFNIKQKEYNGKVYTNLLLSKTTII